MVEYLPSMWEVLGSYLNARWIEIDADFFMSIFDWFIQISGSNKNVSS